MVAAVLRADGGCGGATASLVTTVAVAVAVLVAEEQAAAAAAPVVTLPATWGSLALFSSPSSFPIDDSSSFMIDFSSFSTDSANGKEQEQGNLQAGPQWDLWPKEDGSGAAIQARQRGKE